MGTLKRLRSTARDERGNVLAIVIATMAVLLTFSGVAMDIGRVVAAKAELQRALDAASLAGAGNLNPFLGSTIPTGVRSNTVSFAAANPYSGGTVTLNSNSGNTTGGNVVTGVYDGSTWVPSLDGNNVNAVNCQWTAPIPTSFLGLLGISTLSVTATARGFVGPPALLNAPILPVALPATCDFTSQTSGCGTPQTFEHPAWVSLDGTSPSAAYFKNAIDTASNGTNITVTTGSSITVDTASGNKASVAHALSDDFALRFDPASSKYSPVYTVQNAAPTTTYTGRGWRVAFPVIETACPQPASISGTYTVKSFAYFIITQYIDNNGDCAVTNDYAGSQWAQYCPGGANAGTLKNGGGTLFGYYECTRVPLLSMPPSPGNITGTGILGTPILVK